MNALNRLLIVLLDLVLLVCCGAIVVVTVGWIGLSDFASIHWVYDRLAPFAGMSGADEIETLAIGSALLLLGLVLLVFELATLIPGERPLTLKEDGLGRVTVDRDVVRELASREARQVPGVVRFRPQVTQNRAGVEIRGPLAVEPAANLAEVTQQVQDRIKTTVERALGQPVGDVRLDAELASLDHGRRVH
jgi:uncharacterized alkaline shock family protein YloU